MSPRPARDRQLARRRLERQRARELVRRRRRRRRVVVAGVALALLVVAGAVHLAGGGPATPDAATPASQPCSYRAAGTANRLVTTRPTPPGFGTRRNGAATMVTNRGTVVFDLLANDAPCATTSFAFLAARRYFDGAACDRLTTGGLQFLQCGHPRTGTGPGYVFGDENLSSGTSYPAGTVAMVNSGPDTNGGEFFLCYGDTDLPPRYVPFGRVTSGLDVLTAIAAAGAAPAGDGAPRATTTIRSLRTTGI